MSFIRKMEIGGRQVKFLRLGQGTENDKIIWKRPTTTKVDNLKFYISGKTKDEVQIDKKTYLVIKDAISGELFFQTEKASITYSIKNDYSDSFIQIPGGGYLKGPDDISTLNSLFSGQNSVCVEIGFSLAGDIPNGAVLFALNSNGQDILVPSDNKYLTFFIRNAASSTRLATIHVPGGDVLITNKNLCDQKLHSITYQREINNGTSYEEVYVDGDIYFRSFTPPTLTTSLPLWYLGAYSGRSTPSSVNIHFVRIFDSLLLETDVKNNFLNDRITS
jgi:hypothetical protein